MRKNLAAFFLSFFLCFIILEIFLRIFNPFAFRVRGNEIILPVNQKYHFNNNDINAKLDKEILHTKNSLGFRGRELPKDYVDKLSIITVGGSTTECFYLNDNRTWPNLLEQKLSSHYKDIWLNNAGLDGHSTYGHTILINDYLIKLKPKIILFLIGVNDIGRDDLNDYDRSSLIKKKQMNGIREIVKSSEVVSIIVNISRNYYAKRRQIAHGSIDISNVSSLEISSSLIQKRLEEQKQKYLEGYRQRVLRLVAITKENGIEPVLITQPSLLGEGYDRTTGINLETVKISNSMNGKLNWKTMQLYNDVLREISRSNDCFLIDLAMILPKDSLYYYDWYHFTNEGAQRVADIVCAELKLYLDNKYAVFIKH